MAHKTPPVTHTLPGGRARLTRSVRRASGLVRNAAGFTHAVRVTDWVRYLSAANRKLTNSGTRADTKRDKQIGKPSTFRTKPHESRSPDTRRHSSKGIPFPTTIITLTNGTNVTIFVCLPKGWSRIGQLFQHFFPQKTRESLTRLGVRYRRDGIDTAAATVVRLGLLSRH